MLLTLLLEVTTTKSVTTTIQAPLAIYASLGVAMLAAWASLKATRVAREVGSLAARTAQEIKVTEYKNDYYKKIIDKRIQAFEASQLIVSLFDQAKQVTLGPPKLEDAVFDGQSKPNAIIANVRVVYPPMSPVFSLFSDSYLIGEYDKNIRSYRNYAVWLDVDSSNAMAYLMLAVEKVRILTKGLPPDEAERIFAEYFNVIHNYAIKVSACLDSDLILLHDVDAFFSRTTKFHEANGMGSIFDGNSISP